MITFLEYINEATDNLNALETILSDKVYTLLTLDNKEMKNIKLEISNNGVEYKIKYEIEYNLYITDDTNNDMTYKGSSYFVFFRITKKEVNGKVIEKNNWKYGFFSGNVKRNITSTIERLGRRLSDGINAVEDIALDSIFYEHNNVHWFGKQKAFSNLLNGKGKNKSNGKNIVNVKLYLS